MNVPARPPRVPIDVSEFYKHGGQIDQPACPISSFLPRGDRCGATRRRTPWRTPSRPGGS
jgi:hypothetical protein